jgi:hypothetical protein
VAKRHFTESKERETRNHVGWRKQAENINDYMVNNYNRALRLARKSPISLVFNEPLLQSHETESCVKKVPSDLHLSRSYILGHNDGW